MTIFAVMAIVLVATSGAVVDFVSVDQARNRAQLALDAATLALQPRIYTDSKENLRKAAEKLVIERLADSSIVAKMTDVDTDITDGTLYLRAELKIPLNFVALVGVPSMTVSVISQATRKKLYVEVAFVLDNSGSMGQYNRMGNLKTAATCATKILFYGISNCNSSTSGLIEAENVKIGVVPFTTFVNVGAGNKNASWMDKDGKSPVSKENFDDDDHYDPNNPMAADMSRFDRYDDLKNVSWEGCVEARPYPYSTDDTLPTTSNPATLFVPVFAPDEPDDNWDFNNSYIDDTPNWCPTYDVMGDIKGYCDVTFWDGKKYKGDAGNYARFWPDSNKYSYQDGTDKCTCNRNRHYEYTDSYWGKVYTYSCNNGTASSGYTGGDNGSSQAVISTNNLSDRELQERICKYDGAYASYGAMGPNGDCPGASLLPLTDNPNTVINTINSMSANGSTNIHQGAIWGFHALTPAEPLTGGRAYDTAVSKVMIIMTDGENVYVGRNNMNKSEEQAYGLLFKDENPNNRVGVPYSNSGNMAGAMDKLTVETCDNAKKDDIQVYTIGLSSPNNSTKQMLKDCASSDDHAYFPSQPSELTSVFQAIAEQLAQLRLEK